jgi:hypothetical protein
MSSVRCPTRSPTISFDSESSALHLQAELDFEAIETAAARRAHALCGPRPAVHQCAGQAALVARLLSLRRRTAAAE